MDSELIDNLVAIELRDVDEIIRDINSDDWMHDDELMDSLIKDLTALLISYDTNTDTGKDLTSVVNLVERIIQSTMGDGQLETMNVTISDSLQGRPVLIAFSPELKTDVSNALAIANKSDNDHTRYPLTDEVVKMKGATIHVHVDTVPIKEKVKNRTAYYNPITGQVIAGGVIDMQAQVASLPFIIRKLRAQNTNMPLCFVVTSGEEKAGISDSSYKLIRAMNSEIAIDLEPISAKDTGVFSVDIAAVVQIQTYLDEAPNFTEISNFLKRTFPLCDGDINFIYKYGLLKIDFPEEFEVLISTKLDILEKYFALKAKESVRTHGKAITYKGLIAGVRSSLVKKVGLLHAFYESLESEYPSEPAKFTLNTKSSIPNPRKPRYRKMHSNYLTELALWSPYIEEDRLRTVTSNWLIFSVNEAGNEGRHPKKWLGEALILKQVRYMVNTLSNFLSKREIPKLLAEES